MESPPKYQKNANNEFVCPHCQIVKKHQNTMHYHIKRDHEKDFTDLKNVNSDFGRRVGDWRLAPKEAVLNLQDMTKTNGRSPYGQPVYDMYNRQYITNKMNNLSPLEAPNTVGPGLGLDPSVKAGGGFQDFFRVLPTNINEEKLTTLEGRTGPAASFIKSGGAGGMGEMTHNASKSITAYRPPGAFGGGGAQGRASFPRR